MNLKKLMTWGLLCLSANMSAAEKPNIVYILADDLGYGDLGCYGQEVIQTPNLDKMAAEGLRFTQHYAGSPVCGPSRAVMFSGLHAGNTYLRGNGYVQMRPDPLDMLFPTALQKVGYHTAMIGKSGLTCNSSDASLPGKKGFNRFYGFTSHTKAHWYYPNYLWDDEKKIEFPNNTLHEGDNFSSDLIMEQVMKYLDQPKDKPFFLHVAFQMPHASLRVQEEWKAKYRPILKEKLLPARKEHWHYSYEREPKTTYAAMVSCMDHNVGLIVEKLKELGIEKNTLVMFSSDNGAMQEGGHHRSNFNSSGNLRGGKRDLYEGGVRTPTVAWWPGKIEAGKTTDHLSGFWDISSTMRELAGAEPQADTDGLSLVPTLLGKGTQKKHDYIYWEFHEQGGKRAVRQGKWKLLHFGVGKNIKAKHVELFNLENDESEKNNLAKKYPEIVSELTKLMRKAHTTSEVTEFKFADELTPEELIHRQKHGK